MPTTLRVATHHCHQFDLDKVHKTTKTFPAPVVVAMQRKASRICLFMAIKTVWLNGGSDNACVGAVTVAVGSDL